MASKSKLKSQASSSSTSKLAVPAPILIRSWKTSLIDDSIGRYELRQFPSAVSPRSMSNIFDSNSTPLTDSRTNVNAAERDEGGFQPDFVFIDPKHGRVNTKKNLFGPLLAFDGYVTEANRRPGVEDGHPRPSRLRQPETFENTLENLFGEGTEEQKKSEVRELTKNPVRLRDTRDRLFGVKPITAPRPRPWDVNSNKRVFGSDVSVSPREIFGCGALRRSKHGCGYEDPKTYLWECEPSDGAVNLGRTSSAPNQSGVAAAGAPSANPARFIKKPLKQFPDLVTQFFHPEMTETPEIRQPRRSRKAQFRLTNQSRNPITGDGYDAGIPHAVRVRGNLSDGSVRSLEDDEEDSSEAEEEVVNPSQSATSPIRFKRPKKTSNGRSQQRESSATRDRDRRSDMIVAWSSNSRRWDDPGCFIGKTSAIARHQQRAVSPITGFLMADPAANRVARDVGQQKRCRDRDEVVYDDDDEEEDEGSEDGEEYEEDSEDEEGNVDVVAVPVQQSYQRLRRSGGR